MPLTLTEDNDLELIVARQHTGTSDGTQNVGTSALQSHTRTHKVLLCHRRPMAMLHSRVRPLCS